MTERFAVLGSPIQHSQSPAIHTAAYRALGLDWSYERIELAAGALAAFVSGPGRLFRGCSLTMPLKAELLRLADTADESATLTGVANTMVWGDTNELRVYNTDVAGIERALTRSGAAGATSAMVLGGGATSASAIAAVARLGVEHVQLRLRSPENAHTLRTLADRLTVSLSVDALDPAEAMVAPGPVDVLVTTLPPGVLDPYAAGYAELAALALDVSYDPWPSRLASLSRASKVLSGLEMLVEQALIQVRIFVAGEPEASLPDEARVLAEMRGALPALCED